MSTSARYTREIPQRYRLEAAKCKGCSKLFFPPRLICDECGGKEFEPHRLSDKGKVVSYSVVRVAPSQFVEQVPYIVSVVELEDGVRLTCQVADAKPEELEIGTSVTIEFRKIGEEGDAGIIHYGYKAVLDRFK